MATSWRDNLHTCLLMIRQSTIHKNLSGMSQIEAAVVQSAMDELANSVNVHDLGTLCKATGVLMFQGAEVSRILGTWDFSNMLSDSILSSATEAAMMPIAAENPFIHTCCGVIFSVLLSNKHASIHRGVVNSCIMAAMCEVLLQQVLEADKAPQRSQFATSCPSILVYASNITSMFSRQLLEAKSLDELASFIMPLATLAQSICLPGPGCNIQHASDYQRSALQRKMLAYLLEIVQHYIRLLVMRPPSHTGLAQPHRNLPNVIEHIQRYLFKPNSAMNDGMREIRSKEDIQPAIQVAHVVSMIYHEQSSATAPHLSRLLSSVLQTLATCPLSGLLLAQHITRPRALHSHALVQVPVPDSLFSDRGSFDAETELSLWRTVKRHLQHEINDVYQPAQHCDGYWLSAAVFMLTLIVPVLPEKDSTIGDGFSSSFWNELLAELFPVLVVLSFTSQYYTMACELFMRLVTITPNRCDVKFSFCTKFISLLCLRLPDPTVADMVGLTLACVSQQCGTESAVACSKMCIKLCESGVPVDVHLQMIAVLMSVIVHGKPQCMKSTLDLLTVTLGCIPGKRGQTKALSMIRDSLSCCHDFWKKPQCVRWYHEVLKGA